MAMKSAGILNRFCLLHALLFCFVFTQAIVPPGVMPGAIQLGSPFLICPGDRQNAPLLELGVGAQSSHHHHHHEHPSRDHSNHAEGYQDCEFSPPGMASGIIPAAAGLIIPGLPVQSFDHLKAFYIVGAEYQRPFPRAPPFSLFL
ncbi:MAG: hypothetical protein R3208_14735 [Ketobacteraceae bacterium]|nr:hypothetical protein [Ketobacteraceae bacterium]